MRTGSRLKVKYRRKGQGQGIGYNLTAGAARWMAGECSAPFPTRVSGRKVDHQIQAGAGPLLDAWTNLGTAKARNKRLRKSPSGREPPQGYEKWRLLTGVADADHGHLGHTRQQQNFGDAKLLLGLFKGSCRCLWR